MTFKEATDRLVEMGLEVKAMADALGIPYQNVRRMRLAEGTASYRTPPPAEKWRPVLAALARERAADLQRLARELGRP